MVCVVVLGISGSGKSTFADRLVATRDGRVLERISEALAERSELRVFRVRTTAEASSANAARG